MRVQAIDDPHNQIIVRVRSANGSMEIIDLLVFAQRRTGQPMYKGKGPGVPYSRRSVDGVLISLS